MATKSTAFQGALPTYGALIDMFEEFGSDQYLLCAEISKQFPCISIKRPGRLVDTITRIAAPTKPSLNRVSKLTGSPLRSYRERTWEPRVRTAKKDDTEYPHDLIAHGLTSELLISSMSEIKAGKVTVWSLSGRIPTIGFYRALHHYLKQHFKATKTAIGKLYCGIDANIKEKGIRPDNIYRFVERVISSQRHSGELMLYDTQPAKSMSIHLKKCSEQLEMLNLDCTDLRSKFENTKSQLRSTKCALRDVTNQNSVLKQRLKAGKEKMGQLRWKNASLEEECVNLQVDLLSETTDSADSDPDDSVMEPTLQSIIGNSKKYTPEIRKLYYSLLEEQVPVSKITDIIRHVLKCFNPTESVEDLQLPKRSCASYMRKEELKTICDAHKATVISELSTQSKQLHLNTDGTTKNQIKLGGVVANDLVFGVNELQDGSAASAIDDISREFERLRHAASILGLPNPNSINWTLIVSSTSDSAATQKRINKLIEECRQSDEQRFGPATTETIDLIETFCSMHLGVNLRKSFLNGLVDIDDESERRYHRVDTLVHEFCKLFGTSGVPEYCSGVVSFPQFLQVKISSTSGEQQTYYRNCSKVRLHRQVGSRYFVSAANACKVLYLRNAAIDYLKYTGKDVGNKLERDVLLKLQDPVELSHLKADSLMYYHIYSDLCMLSKSKELGLSALSMNQHYLELQLYLSEVIKDPDVVFERNYPVFPSEKRIYGTNSKLNHRLKSPVVYDVLFEDVNVDASYLQSLLVKGATSMLEKLCSYAADQLPGGRYWNPDKEIQDVLCQLHPSNDVCESVLGLNDYLTTAVPNLHQMSRSNLVQLKKNKTMKWLSQLPNEKQTAVIDMAVKQRRQVKQTYNEEQTARVEHRKQAMIKDHAKREAMKKRLYDLKQKLSQLHLITTSQELTEELLKIDMKNVSATRKRSLKMDILKTQVRIRKKVLGQTVPITFSSNRKQRPVADVTQELCDFITKTIPSEFTSFIEQPTTLVGKRIKQRFQDEPERYTWYVGTVIDYRLSDKTHCIEYDGEEEVCYFDITIDFLNGDIVLLN